MRWKGEGERWIGKSGKAKFEVGRWVNGWGATLSYPGDSYGILDRAETPDEAKRFCEFAARAMGFEK